MTTTKRITHDLKTITERRDIMQMIALRETGRDQSVVRAANVVMRSLEAEINGERLALELSLVS